MPTSTRSSSASASCRPADPTGRFELRASPLLVAIVLALAAAAAFAVLASEMPRVAAWPVSLAALAHGAWLARREAQRRPGELMLAAGGRASVDGVAVEDLSVRWRGTAAFVQWRDMQGRRHRHVFLPDTLPRTRRRELRLAMPAARPARGTASVAP